MALKFSMILEAVDRASAPARRAQSAISRLTGGVRRWGQDVRRVAGDINSGARSMEHYERRARRLRQVAIGSVFRAASEQARRMSASVREAVRNLDLLGRAGRGAKAGLGWMGGKALGAAKWAAAGASAFASFGVFDMFRQAGQMEQFRIAFEVAEGSAEKAKAKMDWISKFAADTPYELNEVMESFRNLQSVAGVDPTQGTLAIVGDAAAGLSKDLMQVTEAYSDAVNMQFERLLDLGLRVSQQGDKVTFNYRKNSKAITKTVKKDALEVKGALESIWKEMFAGSTLAQSKSLFGIISNIKDMWGRFVVMVADAGIFEVVKRDLEGILATVNRWAEDGTMKAWAEGLSKNMEAVWEWGVKLYNDVKWDEVGEDVRTIATGFQDGARAIADMVRWSTRLYSIYQNFNPFRGGLIGSMMRGSGNDSDGPGATPPVSGTGRDKLWKDAQPRKSWITRPPPARTGNWNRLSQSSIGPKAFARSEAQKIDVGGTTKVEVTVKGPGTARVVSMQPNDRRIASQVNVGKTMSGPA